MTDARLSRESAEALVDPAAPDVRLSRDSAEALLDPPTPDVRLSRSSAEALLDLPTPEPRLSRLSAQVLLRLRRPYIGWGIPIGAGPYIAPLNVTYIGGASSNIANPTLTVPAGLTAGDEFILVSFHQDGTNPSSTGFSNIETGNAFGWNWAIMRKAATGAETSISVTAGGGAFSRTSTCMVVLRGGIYLSSSSVASSSSSPLTFPTVAVATGQMALAIGLGQFGVVSGDVTGPTGYTTAQHADSSAGKFSTIIGYNAATGPGSSPASTMTGSGTVNQLNGRILLIG